ncbi:HAD-IIIA family hydrolase, partial [Candidatus Woesearchaeota archaeon]|nr:HAD-IIIA family hydrolase [Candidatus Woesearchaeota archaeon]
MNRAVFLDRDGTVTRNTFLVVDPKDAVLEERAADGVKLLNTLGFRVIIVTNQPQVARGLVTEEDVGRINNKIVADLKEKGAHIDAVYFCPHHPETHHIDVPEHAKKYRIACECRKPRTGMLDKAAKDFNIDLSKSFVVGDQTMDILAGKNAGCKTLLVRTGEAGMDGKHDAKPDFVCDNLYRAAVLIKRNLTVKAVILAGGRGERLRPLTDKLPKPMIQVGGKPVLQHQIEALKKSGITEIILCGSYLVDEIKKYFGSGEEFGVNMQYPHEPEHLGSGGAVKNASAYLKDAGRFIVMNGDKMVGSEFDFEQMLDYDDGKDGFMTVLVRETDHPLDSDILK